MKKTLLSLSLLSALTAFSGCTTIDPNSAVAPVKVTLDDQTIADLKANATEAKPLELKLWHSFSDTVLGPMQTQIDNFVKYAKEELGLHFNITVEKIEGGYSSLQKTTVLSIPSGGIPNVILGYPDHFVSYYDKQAIIPLNAFINYDNEMITLKDDMDDFIPAFLDEVKQFGKDANGEELVYGLPFNKSTEIMSYNKTVLNFMGYMEYDSDEYKALSSADQAKYKDIPDTWDESLACAKEILDYIKAGNPLPYTYTTNGKKAWQYYSEDGTEKEVDEVDDNGVKTGNKIKVATVDYDLVYPLNYDSEDNLFITGTHQWGGKYTQTSGTKTSPSSHLLIKDDQNVAAMANYFKKAYEDHLFSIPPVWDELYGSTSFINYQTFMTIGSIAGVAKQAGYTDDGQEMYAYDVAIVPQYNEENKAVIQQGTNLAILNKGKDYVKLASWLLIKYMTGSEQSAQFATTSGYLPVRNSSYDTETYTKFITSTQKSKQVLIATQEVAKEQASFYYYDDAFSGSSTIRDEMENMMKKFLMTKDYTISQAIDEAYKTLG